MVANAIKMYFRNNKIQLSAGEDVFADGHITVGGNAFDENKREFDSVTRCFCIIAQMPLFVQFWALSSHFSRGLRIRTGNFR